mmetsp:Transcript_50269/g.61669  ORF Transcript_50269/g.61669 Transcript_50269/m.61669 type:complete len:227 (+) Transcript_50269:16-696(+)
MSEEAVGLQSNDDTNSNDAGMFTINDEYKTSNHLMISTPKYERRKSHILTNNQLNELKKAFQLFDTNSNGVIDKKELHTAMKLFGQDLNEDQIDEMIDDVDINGDKQIDFNEFSLIMEKRWFQPSNKYEYQDAFKFIDKKGDGVIDFSELKTVLIDLGEDIVDQDIQDMIDEADTNGNGNISFDEFLRMMPFRLKKDMENEDNNDNNDGNKKTYPINTPKKNSASL